MLLQTVSSEQCIVDIRHVVTLSLSLLCFTAQLVLGQHLAPKSLSLGILCTKSHVCNWFSLLRGGIFSVIPSILVSTIPLLTFSNKDQKIPLV